MLIIWLKILYTFLQSPEVHDVLLFAQTCRWQHLSADSYKKACGWLLQSCDPNCLLQSRASPDVLGVRWVVLSFYCSVKLCCSLTFSTKNVESIS